MIIGRYENTSDRETISIDISEASGIYQTYQVKGKAVITSKSGIFRRGELNFTRRLFSNALNFSIPSYRVCLDFESGQLCIFEIGTNPFVGPDIHFAGKYHKVEMALA